MGLHPRVYASDQYTMVLYSKLFGDCAVPQWHGCYDPAQDFVQRYC